MLDNPDDETPFHVGDHSGQMNDGSGILQMSFFDNGYAWRYINKNDSSWLVPGFNFTIR